MSTTKEDRDSRLESALGRVYHLASTESLRTALDEAELYGAVDRLKEMQVQGKPLPADPERRTYTCPQKIAIYEQMNQVLALIGEGRPR